MTAPQKNTRPSPMKRYGPLIAIVAVIAVVGIVIAVMSGGDDDKTSSGGGTSSDVKGLPVTFDQAKAEGNADTINWGPNCNTDVGQVKIPSIYAASCVKPYDAAKGNGGATAHGVTGDEVTVVLYQADPGLDPLQSSLISDSGADVDPDSGRKTAQGYVDLYQQYYETWGRKVNLVVYTGTGAGDNETAAKADAVKIVNDLKPFAVLGGPTQAQSFRNELVASKVMCIGNCALATPNDVTVDASPYLVPTGQSPEQAALLTAEMVCSQFKNGKAVYGGDDVNGKKRVFAIAHYDTPSGLQRPGFETLKGGLEDCGINVKTDVSFTLDIPKAQDNARTVISKLKSAGVTSVIFTGDPLNPIYMTKEATAQNWFPEWIIGPNVLVDIALFGRRYDQEQWSHAFGIKLGPVNSKEELQDPYHLYFWQYGVKPPNNTFGVIQPEIALYFRGMHLAGPNLTPETLQAGLFGAPVRGGNPVDATVSYGEHGLWPFLDLYGSDDATLLWWDPDVVTEDEVGATGTGAYQSADMGKRYRYGKWPTSTIKLFDPSNSIVIYDELPPAAQPPDYPSPAG